MPKRKKGKKKVKNLTQFDFYHSPVLTWNFVSHKHSALTRSKQYVSMVCQFPPGNQ